MMSLRLFLDEAWKKYVKLTPDAPRILELLTARGETIVNDHVAFRTFNLPGLDRHSIGRVFEQWGYHPVEDLAFPEKKLLATYYLHPDSTLPKIFVSELLVERFSANLQGWVREVCGNVGAKTKLTPEFFLEDSWGLIRFEDYENYYQDSEYAAWTAAFGVQVNHFTVSVNSLKSFPGLQALNSFLVDHHFELNSSGGAIKGSPQELLEQSSTMATRVPWKFANGIEKEIMGCYYEFAKRYPIPGTDRLFQGFIPKSANKIFESTFEKLG